MASLGGSPSSSESQRSLSGDYSAWLGIEIPLLPQHFTQGLIVFDTNTLLALYEVGSDSRREIIEVMGKLGDRLWLPHRVALEFSRNRRRVVLDRVGRFKKARQTVKSAPRDAVDLLEKAVASVVALRGKNRTAREWNLEEAKLDRAALEEHVKGVLDAALNELNELEAEHDLRPTDVQEIDQVYSELDRITAGKIGSSPSVELQMTQVREALDIRYPNEVPPGYQDASKSNEIDAAGDYLLWREIVAEARDRGKEAAQVMFVTDDFKADWWSLDEREKALHARPELIEELRSEAQSHLTLVSLSGFLNGAREYLSATVSERTVQDVLESRVLESESVDLKLSFRNRAMARTSAFEEEVRRLFMAMGYALEDSRSRRGRTFDFVLLDEADGTDKRIGVEVKHYNRVTPREVLMQVLGMMSISGIDAAIIVTSSYFPPGLHADAAEYGIRLIDGVELNSLFSEYLFDRTDDSGDRENDVDDSQGSVM